MKPEIKNKIIGEANWRSTNGHGGVDDITRDNFIQAAEYGYSLASEEQSGERLVQIKQLLSNNDFLRRDLAEKDKEIAELKAWKESAMSATQLGCHEKQMPG